MRNIHLNLNKRCSADWTGYYMTVRPACPRSLFG